MVVTACTDGYLTVWGLDGKFRADKHVGFASSRALMDCAMDYVTVSDDEDGLRVLDIKSLETVWCCDAMVCVLAITQDPPSDSAEQDSDDEEDEYLSARVVAPALVLAAKESGSLPLFDLRTSSTSKAAHSITLPPSSSPIGAFPVHSGGRQELHRWDGHSIVALVELADSLQLLSYDVRGADVPTSEHVLSNAPIDHAVVDVAGSTAAVAWRNLRRLNTRRTPSNRMQLQLWDLHNGCKTAALDGKGQRRLYKLQSGARNEHALTGELLASPVVLRLTDDGRHVLLSNNPEDDALRGSVSVWGRSEAFDSDCTTLRHVSRMYPSLLHSVPCPFCGDCNVGRQSVCDIDCAETLVATADDEGVVRFAMFGDQA